MNYWEAAMSNDGKGTTGSSPVPRKTGVHHNIDRYEEWLDNSQAYTRKEIKPDFVSSVWDILDAAGNLLIQKHHDYGPKNISQSPGGPLNGLRVRIWDKIARINNLIDSGVDPENESLRDSFVDLLNYSAIALMVLDGTWPE